MKPLHLLLAATVLGGAFPAHAQLGLPSLPSLPLPDRIGPLGTGALQAPIGRLLDRAPLADLGRLRLEGLAALVARYPDRFEMDTAGNVAVRGEILAWSPGEAGLQAAAAAGLSIVRDEAQPELGQRLVVLRGAAGQRTVGLLPVLRAADPDGVYDFNHVYAGGGGAGAGSGAAAPSASPRGGSAVRVGLVDSGVDASHPVFEDSKLQRWGCGGAAHPAPHGTAVAALMVGQSERFSGAAPGASLFAADVYCDDPAGGSVDRLVAALGWLAREGVGVVNISLVGPRNAALARAVEAMLARGHLLVAAVGNDGPAAPPLYPASYPGVVGVTGVDRRGQVLPEAGRGPQVMFAAPGSQMVSAVPGSPPYRQVRGTSYAAPIVAALLARELPSPDRQAARRALDTLVRVAGAGGQGEISNVVGHGVLGADLRIDPARLR
ncbi:S8 family serine peptidase [Massilia sp. 9I]|uniref:S8 family serine peptidase n=1 Tax=Massilia sp. 9I TaxID=2653152 RepID=UPI0012F3D702|nr:S8 family serine peptidase [Massilia sp. 9I]VXB77241.1 Peptidase S8 and S53, subtilisin, kexin, sedolisin [Massilia sp. 9I]